MRRFARDHAVTVWSAATAVVAAAYFTTAGVVQAVVYAAFAVATSAAIVLGVRRYHPTRRLGWWALAAGTAAWAIGDLAWYFDDLIRHRTPVLPGPADLPYLLGYAVLAFGLGQLASVAEDSLSIALDALTLTIGVAVVVWIPLVDPVLDAHRSLWSTAIAVAYPFGDLLLVAMAARLLLGGARRRPALVLLVAAACCSFLADSSFAWLSRTGTYEAGQLVDLGWLGTYALLAAAALHPSMSGVGRVEPTPSRVGRSPVLGLWFVAVVAPAQAAWAVRSGSPDSIDFVLLAGLAAIVVMIRMTRLLRRTTAEAHRDRLTGLGNREHVLQHLEQALHQRRAVSVLFLDLDRFKGVNDEFGHSGGDRLLVAVAARLTEALPEGCTVGRIGGDEFVVVCPDLTAPQVEAVADQLVAAFHVPFTLAGGLLHISVSVGVAAAEPGGHADDLLADADAAMYAAKAAGKGRWRPYRRDLREASRHEREVEQELRLALAQNDLDVHYQPVIDLTTEVIVGAEALVRWFHPQRGLVGPKDFIAIAEDAGHIDAIGRHVLRTATADMRALPEHLSVSVNVSARQFDHGGLVDEVREATAVAGVDPARLVLEITESLLVDGSSSAFQQIEALRRLGVRFAIDDFGTGFSSLSRLKRLPASILKIDRSFVAGVVEDASDRTIVAGIAYLAHGFGLEVVAEGVESADQRDAVRQLGCSMGQGTLWSGAVSLGALRQLLAAETRSG